MNDHNTPPGARPTPADAKRRAEVQFRSGKHARTGTLTYWPGATSTRPPTVIGSNGHRYHPNPEEVTLMVTSTSESPD